MARHRVIQYFRFFPNGVVEVLLRLARKFRPVRERVRPGEFGDYVEREHVARYQFATRFCRNMRVADIACGTGYGMHILRTVAVEVDGFDKEPLCGNFVIDLEKTSWEREYDVIVSFETVEHLSNPEFFVENAWKTAKELIVSSPIGELRGYNGFHKQTWQTEEFQALLEARFECEYYSQEGEEIRPGLIRPVGFLIAVCKPKPARTIP